MSYENSVREKLIIGVGVQKCASSWLYQVLSEHPSITPSTIKEIDFFSYYYDRGIEWYERHFIKKENNYSFEISPSYFYNRYAAERLKRYAPNAKIIIALRDPIERAYSQHLHEIRVGHIAKSDTPFEWGVENNETYLEQSRYGKYIDMWIDVFGEENIFITLQEDIKNSPKSEVVRLYDFLGIENHFFPESIHEASNVSYVPRNRKLEKKWQSTANFLRRNGFRPAVDLLRKTKIIDGYIQRSRLNARGIVPPMTEDTKNRLKIEFHSEYEYLKALLKKKNIPWKNFE